MPKTSNTLAIPPSYFSAKCLGWLQVLVDAPLFGDLFTYFCHWKVSITKTQLVSF